MIEFLAEKQTGHCLLCGPTEAAVVRCYDAPDRYESAVGVSAENYFRRWMRCSQCGLHYSVYSRDPHALDELYASAYRSTTSNWRNGSVEQIFNKVVALPESESETKFRVNWIKRSIGEMKASGLIEDSAPPYRMLDIGGATGVFAYEFQDERWRAHVVDPDENGKFLQEKLGIPFLQQPYRAGQFAIAFDLVSLVFVLEHMIDPSSTLREVRKDMGKNSLLYIEVPSELAFRLKSEDDDIFNSCHLWIFSANTLTRLLHTCGFETLALLSTQTKRGHYSLMALAARQ